jgi:hypothetical protein
MRPVRKADNLTTFLRHCLEIWEPQRPETLRVCPGLYRDCFIFTWASLFSEAIPRSVTMRCCEFVELVCNKSAIETDCINMYWTQFVSANVVLILGSALVSFSSGWHAILSLNTKSSVAEIGILFLHKYSYWLDKERTLSASVRRRWGLAGANHRARRSGRESGAPLRCISFCLSR